MQQPKSDTRTSNSNPLLLGSSIDITHPHFWPLLACLSFRLRPEFICGGEDNPRVTTCCGDARELAS